MKYIYMFGVLMICLSCRGDNDTRDKEIIAKIKERGAFIGLRMENIQIVRIKEISEKQYVLCAWDDVREELEELKQLNNTSSKWVNDLQHLQDSITTVASKANTDKIYGYHVRVKGNFFYDNEWKKEELFWVVAKDGIANPCEECNEILK